AVVSGSDSRTDVLAALAAGVNGFVPKGLRDDDLVAALRTILAGAIYVPATLAQSTGPAAEPVSPGIDLARLTPRQREVLDLLVEGRSNKEIARALDLGHGTVKIHLAAVFRHLGVSNRAAAAAIAAPLLGRG
ncbi:response regulator transcription factor, partial [Phreatobacter sp.]|uniref:LuxR C-terminal-related transcriptional regulator n=1 Tax=Phreatobacter sp. TaxID=1966341 RepID=UPI0022BF186B